MGSFHIGVNLVYLRPGAVGGSETYVRGLLDALAQSPKVRLTLYCSKEGAQTFSVGEAVAITRSDYSLGQRLWAENAVLRRTLDADPVDVLFSPANFAAPLLPARIAQVVTVHDLQHVRLPGNFTRRKRAQRNTMFRLSLRRCRRVLAISEYTRRDVIECFKVSRRKIVTVHEGVDRCEPADLARIAAARANFALERPFVYYPATDLPHKNHSILIKALEALRRKHSDVDVELICSGSRSSNWSTIERQARDLGVADRVRHIGWVERHEVFALLQMARAMVFPSVFEGFGLPTLEAMRCDTPVIASSAGSIPEIVRDGGMLLSPSDTEGWCDAIYRVLTDAGWAREMVERGRSNLEDFSWEKCAGETLAVLQDAASEQ